jgi:hypothetical protein
MTNDKQKNATVRQQLASQEEDKEYYYSTYLEA